MNLREVNIYVPMVDLMTCTLMTVFVLFIAALVEVRPDEPPAKKPTIATDGLFAVTLEWPAQSNDDVDLYVMNSEQDICYFSKPSAGLMHLERDDLGRANDMAKTKNGRTITIERNEERTIIRGIVPGEYIVNVHMYAKNDAAPTPVTVKLFRIKEPGAPLTMRELTLTRDGDEQTAFRVTIDEGERTTGINELPYRMTGRAASPMDFSPYGGVQ
jgi:hypothetical protein